VPAKSPSFPSASVPHRQHGVLRRHMSLTLS
jgi:hypothetical protein